MEPMTPEERFTRIENAIESLAETAAKHEAAIRDLIVVGRTLIEGQRTTGVQINELREIVKEHQQATSEHQRMMAEHQRTLAEQQRTTEEKLNALIDVVDRIIRNRNL